MREKWKGSVDELVIDKKLSLLAFCSIFNSERLEFSLGILGFCNTMLKQNKQDQNSIFLYSNPVNLAVC